MTKTETIVNWLNSRFRYKRDGKLDSWRIMRLNGEVLQGDCDDYSVTLMYLLSEESMLRMLWNLATFKFIPWFCRLPDGQYHIALWVRGEGWIDNVQKKFTKEKPKYRWYFPYPFPAVLVKLAIGGFAHG